MPLRDHFSETEIPKPFHWESFHFMWAGELVRYLNRRLLPRHFGAGADLSQEDLFEVEIFEDEPREHLVAAIELICPRNKDLSQGRHDFVAKCASMLKAHISLVLIDIVTNRHANLFKDLMEYLEIRGLVPPLIGPVYCCSLLPRGSNGRAKVLDVWPAILQVGAVLPTVPLWLRGNLAVPLDLESTYEETCGDLRA
jgi:hypothetical protein